MAFSTARNDARLLELENQRNDFIEKWESADEDIQLDRYTAELNRIEDAIATTPAESREGLFVKSRNVQYWTSTVYGGSADEVTDAFEGDLMRIIAQL